MTEKKTPDEELQQAFDDAMKLGEAYKRASTAKIQPDQVFDTTLDGWVMFVDGVVDTLSTHLFEMTAEEMFKVAFTMGACYGTEAPRKEPDGE